MCEEFQYCEAPFLSFSIAGIQVFEILVIGFYMGQKLYGRTQSTYISLEKQSKIL